MSSLKNKLKVKTNLAKALEDNESGRKEDKRFLNYFDLKFEEKMTVLFVPDENGEVWRKYRQHNAPKGVYGLPAIGCAGAGDCPICQKFFDLWEVAKETDEKEDKDAAKVWGSNNKTIASVIVIDSPCDINEDETGNQLKLFNMPFNVEEVIRQSIAEGFVDEDTITSTPFVIKKTKNQGNRPSYAASYFARDQITDDDIEALDELQIDLYNFDDLDIIPETPSTSEAEEWVEKLEEKLSKKNDKDSGDSKSKVSNRLNRKPAKRDDDDEQEDDSGDEKESENNNKEESQSDDEPASTSGSSIRDRLRNRR